MPFHKTNQSKTTNACCVTYQRRRMHSNNATKYTMALLVLLCLNFIHVVVTFSTSVNYLNCRISNSSPGNKPGAKIKGYNRIRLDRETVLDRRFCVKSSQLCNSNETIEEKEDDEIGYEKFQVEEHDVSGGDNHNTDDDDDDALRSINDSLGTISSTASSSSSNSESIPPNTTDSIQDETRVQIEQQQKQIDLLMEMMRNQSSQQHQQQQQQQQQQPTKRPTTTNNNNNSSDDLLTLPPPIPGIFDEHQGEDELLDYSDDNMSTSTTSTSSSQSSQNSDQDSNNSGNNVAAVPQLAPLKVMLFIDGTWLYYSLYRRKEDRDPIVKKFGRGWQHRYKFDWNALPRIICEQLVDQQINLGWSASGLPETTKSNMQAQRPMEIVRASVFTSYKKTTDPKSFRVKMYNEMANANYDLHMLESVGNGPEKCVDISLAVEMLHYATVPNAYDVAILLSGDKDFIPALVRTRQKGRKVGIVAMKTGCNRALYESPHIKDFDVVWIDHFLDELLVPLPPDQVDRKVESVHDRGLLSAFTITKVIYDFIHKSPFENVSSRDIGRYLKGLEIKGGTTLLDDVKLGQSGLRRFLQDRMPTVFEVTDKTGTEKLKREMNDKSYWVSVKSGATESMLVEAKTASLTDEEKQFLTDYQTKSTGGDDLKEEEYFYTLESTTESAHFPKQTIEDVSNRLLNNESGVNKVDLSIFTVTKLKEMCRERNLHVSGTKALLIERIENDVENETQHSTSFESLSNTKRENTMQNEEEQTSKYLEELVSYYITQSGGHVSSRDLGRFLSTNKAYKSDSLSALQQLKKTFGGVASFLNQRTHIFSTMRDQDQTNSESSNNFSFQVELREGNYKLPGYTMPAWQKSPNDNNTILAKQKAPFRKNAHNIASQLRPLNVDQNVSNHIESLMKEYLRATRGVASSRDIGRYLAANSAYGTSSGPNQPYSKRQTALQQLKQNYGSLASYLTSKEDVFSTVSGDLVDTEEGMPASLHTFGVKLK